jgi:molybdenum cofactor cytidylyltransferase
MGGALILAAGFSRRFGSDKRQHLISIGGDEKLPMACATARLYAQTFTNTVVVLRAEDAELESLLHREVPQVTTVFAADSHLGMGHSLAAGIRAVDGWPFVFVGLADMPFVRIASLIALQDRMVAQLATDANTAVIVQPSCDGRPGHPVGFSSDYFAQLSRLTGDKGAKALMVEAGERLQTLALDDPGVLQDLDQPE